MSVFSNQIKRFKCCFDQVFEMVIEIIENVFYVSSTGETSRRFSCIASLMARQRCQQGQKHV